MVTFQIGKIYQNVSGNKENPITYPLYRSTNGADFFLGANEVSYLDWNETFVCLDLVKQVIDGFEDALSIKVLTESGEFRYLLLSGYLPSDSFKEVIFKL